MSVYHAIKQISKLIRLDYSIVSALGVIVSGLLSTNLFSFQLDYIFTFFTVFFCAVGSFALNDYFDFEADRRNERFNRPLVSGVLSRRIALGIGLLAFSLCAAMSLLLSQQATVLVLISLPFFVFYSPYFKKVFLAKNIVISYAFTVTILLGSLAADVEVKPIILYFAIMGFIVGLAFEIMLDIGDVQGDRASGIKTLSTRFGVETAAKISVILYSTIVFLDPLPFFVAVDSHLYMNFLFLGLILIPVFSYSYVITQLHRIQTTKMINKLKKQIFLTMQLGCFAYVIGILFG